MKIETKYEIGQKIWVTQEHDGVVNVTIDTITEVLVNSAGKILYFAENTSDEIPEEYIISYENTEQLLKQIKNFLE